MEELYKNILSLVDSIINLPMVTYDFTKDSTEKNGENIIDAIDGCENKFLKVKKEIVKIITDVEDDTKDAQSNENCEVQVIQTDKGFLIKE